MHSLRIEIGTTEQKERWENEIRSIFKAFKKELIEQLNIKEIIITPNFDETVKEIGGISNYESIKVAGEAFAIVVSDSKDNNYIIISGAFWEILDFYEIHFLFILHEIYHIINSMVLPQFVNNCDSKTIYLSKIYDLYNEYSAVRFSTSILIKNEGVEIIKVFYEKYMSGLQNDETFYLPMKKVIENFKNCHLSIDEYNIEIYKYIDSILKYIANIFAFCHSSPEVKKMFNDYNNKIFISEDLIKLFDVYSLWYEGKNFIKYENCLCYIESYLKTLGVKYDDVEEGVYITVLDI